MNQISLPHRLLVAMVTFSAALAVNAEREVTLGEYTREAQKLITGKIADSLASSALKASVAGTVTFADDDQFFLQSDKDGLKVISPEHPLPGTIALVSGRPSMEGGRVVFIADSVRTNGTHALPEPRNADAKTLVYAGDDHARTVNWLRVNVTGRAIGLTEIGFAMELEGRLPVNVAVGKVPDFLHDCEKTHPMISVTGVAELLLDQSVLFGRERYVMGVKIRANSADDIVLKPDAVYLLNRHGRRVMVATTIASIVLVIALLIAAGLMMRQRKRHFKTVTLMSERKRMADDLHDTIEQHLVGATMLIRLGKTAEATDVLVRAKREIRDIVWGLKNDDMMRQTPADMLRELAKTENRKGLYRIDVHLAGLPEALDARAMRDLSLIVREAIGNAVKHGAAKQIAISSDPLEGGGWLLRIANNGKPFDPANALGPKDGHFGVEGIRERARRLGATTAYSQKGAWTILAVEAKASSAK